MFIALLNDAGYFAIAHQRIAAAIRAPAIDAALAASTGQEVKP